MVHSSLVTSFPLTETDCTRTSQADGGISKIDQECGVDTTRGLMLGRYIYRYIALTCSGPFVLQRRPLRLSQTQGHPVHVCTVVHRSARCKHAYVASYRNRLQTFCSVALHRPASTRSMTSIVLRIVRSWMELPNSIMFFGCCSSYPHLHG